MLSRIAESLYWIGRYVERAEDTARILDVHVHRLLEDPSVEEEAACRALLGGHGREARRRPVQRRRHAPDTGLRDARHHVDRRRPRRGPGERPRRPGRHLLGDVGVPQRHLQRPAGDGRPGPGPSAPRLFSYVKERAAILAGLADSTMSRDDGWRFLVLGRSLERVDMTARMLSAGFADAEEPGDWVATLRCCSAHEAFLRTYRRAVTADLVAEFLLLDRLFPRSAFHALGVAEDCLAELQPGAGRAGLDDEARRIVGRARTDLEFRRLQDLLADLPGHLRSLQTACHEAGDAVARRFFRQAAPLEWSLRGAAARMTWRIAITHSTGYRYRAGGDLVLQRGPHHAHLQRPPAGARVGGGGQPAAVAFRYWDYWGTLVHAFDIQVPHIELSVTGTSVVETRAAPTRPTTPVDLVRPGPAPTCATGSPSCWRPPPYVPVDDDVLAAAEHLPAGVDARRPPASAVEWVQGRLRYEKGTTDVSTPAPDVLAPGQRRVPGLRPRHPGPAAGGGHPRPLRVRLPPPPRGGRAGQPSPARATPGSRRGRATGRPSTPPTGSVAERHVVVGRARDYADLSPLHGIYHGGPAEALGVTVELTRLS